MVNVKIDGIEVSVPDGTTVLRAAEAAGVNIPVLCDHKQLAPYGACRLCLVEVEGARTLQPSCTLPASNGMVVYTNTPKVRDARKFVLTLIFSERNHFCMYCPVSGGDCELQNSAYAEGMTHWPLQPNWTPYPTDASHKDFVLDNNRCILCRRCIRACGELVGNFTLGVEERGAHTLVIADLGVPLGQSTCISCGTCVQVCPTGALIDRASAFRGREKDAQRIKSTCSACNVGCGIEMIVRDNHLMRIEGDWAAPANCGLLCELGRFVPLAETRERLVTPLVRKDGALKAATWDEALSTTAAKLKPLAGMNGTGVAALASTRLTAEALCAFAGLFGASGSVDEAGAALPAARRATLADLNAADCVVALGADLVADHQVAGFLVKRALPKGVKLVVVDSGDNGLKTLADVAVTPRKGAEVDLVASLTGEIKAQAGQSPAARLIAGAQKPVIVVGDARYMAAALALAEAANATLLTAQGKANSAAAAAYQLAKAFDARGRKAVFLALGDEQPGQKLIQQIEKARADGAFIAVAASYVSPATAMADVVFPVEMWAEQEGHLVNLEGKVLEIHRGLTPDESVWSSAKTTQALADKMGVALSADWKANW